ncbi:hypothetical protein MMC25_005069 [Agyrium rufum]|nr:hypothetical protein [Agyrium rufum]
MSDNNFNAGGTAVQISRNLLLDSLWAGVIISFLFIVFRLYVRITIFKKLFVDDGFLIFAWLMQVGNAIIWQVNVNKMYLIIAVITRKTLIPPPDIMDELVKYLRGSFAAYVLGYAALWSIKLSVMLFFRRMGESIRTQQIIWWCILTVVMISFVICLVIPDNKCLIGPVSVLLGECRGENSGRWDYIALKVAAVLDVTTDALIVFFPLNILRKVKINMRTKLALTTICSLTVFVMAFAIARIAVFTGTTSIAISMPWLMFWGSIEVTVATIVACLASFRTLYVSAERSSRGASGPRYSRNTSSLHFGGTNSGSIPLSSINDRSHTANRDSSLLKRPALAITVHQSIASSEEYILPPRDDEDLEALAGKNGVRCFVRSVDDPR